MFCSFFHILAVTLVIGIASAQYQQYQPQSFQPASASASPETAKDSNSQSSTPYRYDYSQEEEDEQPVYQQQRRQQQQQNGNNFKKQTFKQQVQEEELEEEEPDRLQLLLEKSTFTCNDRTTGYYADEGLGCEVFHYCQETQKHSWICPEGFSFHQVHLICMPPSGDNICDQSSKYTFVNDYLYKPINMAEHESKPNVTLRYSERYYPENFYLDQRQPDQEQQQQQQHIQQRQPVSLNFLKLFSSFSNKFYF